MTATDLSDYDPLEFDARDGKATKLKDTARKVKQTAAALRERAEPMIGQARTYAGAARQRIDGAVQTVADKAREKPATSALAILGVGIVIGAALAIALRRPASSLSENLRSYGGGLSDGLKTRTSGWTDQIREALRH
jgi:hypothetical protein